MLLGSQVHARACVDVQPVQDPSSTRDQRTESSARWAWWRRSDRGAGAIELKLDVEAVARIADSGEPEQDR